LLCFPLHLCFLRLSARSLARLSSLSSLHFSWIVAQAGRANGYGFAYACWGGVVFVIVLDGSKSGIGIL
jgi:hypothetical protein